MFIPVFPPCSFPLQLEQFNERMRQKKEQQKEAMRSRVKCQKIPPGTIFHITDQPNWLTLAGWSHS
uniref:Uncharacterized protein n=1 Tax=Anguilla anguilla TaxID=7936 RepID=A0A0E9PU73_ANGAN